MKHPTLFALLAFAPALALAAELHVQLELPEIAVSDYRRPYVAVWLEGPDNRVAAKLAVWYDLRMRNDEGKTWLKDLRQWWRRIGRDTALPVDGITGATRNPGMHALRFASGTAALGRLAAGEYRLVVEASREHGGRELLSVPLQWPPTAATQLRAAGEREIGRVAVELIP